MKKRRIFLSQKIFLLTALIFAVLATAATGNAAADQPLLTMTVDSSTMRVSGQNPLNFVLKVQVADNWHIHSHIPNEENLIASRLTVKDGQDFFSLEKIIYPEPKEYRFAFSDKPVSVFDDTFYISGSLAIQNFPDAQNYEPTLELLYQACSDSACSAPATARARLPVTVEEAAGLTGETKETGAGGFPGPGSSPGIDTTAGTGSGVMGKIASAGLAASLLLVFLGGLGLNLTPCVYPIIPITISYFGAQTEGRTSRLFVLGLVYVVGMAVTYSAIGVVSAFSGAFFGGLLQQPVVIGVVAAIFVVLALGMFGWYDFKLPDSLVARAGSGSRTGIPGALLMGLTMGVIAAPCIGPFVLGLVAYVAAVGDPIHGFLLFFFLALGLGSPYLLLALFAGKIKRLPRSGAWMEGVKHIFGLILLAMAVYFAAPLLPDSLRDQALPVFGIFSAAYLLFLDKAGNAVAGFKRLKTGLALALLGICIFSLISPESQKAQWPPFSPAAYADALAKDQKMVMVFHADWCIPCRELDKLTLSSTRVKKALTGFRVFQIDLTRADHTRARQARKRFSVQGVPTIVLVDSNGREAGRITGFIGADEMLRHLSQIQ